MKLLIGGSTVLIIVLVFCILNYLYVTKSLNETIHELESIETLVYNLNWEAANESAEATIKKWHKKESYYMAVLWHQHIDDVAVALNQMQSDIRLRELEESHNSIISACTILRDIIEMESLTLGNIF